MQPVRHPVTSTAGSREDQRFLIPLGGLPFSAGIQTTSDSRTPRALASTEAIESRGLPPTIWTRRPEKNAWTRASASSASSTFGIVQR